jgi:hypothetical protein
MNPFLSALMSRSPRFIFRGKMEIFIFLGFLCGINILVHFFGGVEDLFVSQFFMSKSMHLGAVKNFMSEFLKSEQE